MTDKKIKTGEVGKSVKTGEYSKHKNLDFSVTTESQTVKHHKSKVEGNGVINDTVSAFTKPVNNKAVESEKEKSSDIKTENPESSNTDFSFQSNTSNNTSKTSTSESVNIKTPTAESQKKKTPNKTKKSELSQAVRQGAREIKSELKRRDESGMITSAFNVADTAHTVFKGSQVASAVVWKTVPIAAVGLLNGGKVAVNAVTGKYRIKKRITLAPRIATRTIRQAKYKVVRKCDLIIDNVTKKAIAVNKVLNTDVKVIAKDVQKTVTDKASDIKKILDTPITQEHVKKAVVMTGTVGGKIIKSTAVVGGVATLKTAQVTLKASGKLYTGVSNTLSKSDNELVSSSGTLMKVYKTEAKIAKTATVNTIKGVIKTGKAVKSGWKTISAIKKDGFKKTALNAAKKTANKIAVKTAQIAKKAVVAVAKKGVLPIIIIIVLIAGAAQMMSTPLSAVISYLNETLGWLFDWSDKSDTDEQTAYTEITEKVKTILADDNNKNQHKEAIDNALPTINNGSPLNDSWSDFITDLSAYQNLLTQQQYSCDSDELLETIRFKYDGYTVNETIDYSLFYGDFEIDKYSDYLVMAFFEKFSEDTEMTTDNIGFTDEELKNYLMNWESFTPVSNGQPILKDYVSVSISHTANDVIVEKEASTPIYNMYGNVIGWTMIDVTHRTYVINVTYYPRLKEVSVNPRDYLEDIEENQELFEKYDFAKEYIDSLIN